jgi:hypothetical protein
MCSNVLLAALASATLSAHNTFPAKKILLASGKTGRALTQGDPTRRPLE